MVQAAGVLDLGYKGPTYTWCNNQPPSSLIMQRLDRALAPVPWLTNFPSATVYHLSRFNSDHHPILVRTNPPQSKKDRGFKIENWWFQHPEFSEICNKDMVSSGTGWATVVQDIKTKITKWVRKINRPDRELIAIEEKMVSLQTKPPSTYDREKEIEMQTKYNKCLHQINSYWHQRSRLKWIAEGDLNTSFFHATVAARRRKNTIHMLQLQDGSWTVDSARIHREFTNHFKNMYCQPDDTPQEWPQVVNEALQETLPTLNDEEGQSLLQQPSSLEIANALFALGSDKASGPDGINAHFIQTNWQILQPCT